MVSVDMCTQENTHQHVLSFGQQDTKSLRLQRHNPLHPDPVGSPPQRPKMLHIRRHLHSDPLQNILHINYKHVYFICQFSVCYCACRVQCVDACAHDRDQKVLSSGNRCLEDEKNPSMFMFTPVCFSGFTYTVRLFALCEDFAVIFTHFPPHRSLFERATFARC